ncbi:MAG TPA: hypothetical protein VK302_13620 [Terriglobales bacterium]|nr:hypothetical protein [Terriglobales bacterium]
MVSTDPTRVTAAVSTPSHPPEIFHLGDQGPRTNGTIAQSTGMKLCHLAEGDEWVKIIYPSQCINLPVTSLEFVPAASWDDAPLGRNNGV